MKKTSIYLKPEIDDALASRAAEEGITKAEFIRRGLEGLVTKPKRPKPSVGVVRSGHGGISENVDDFLRETGFGRR